jgi:DNA-binding FadR family transcriptional regulator
MSGRSRARAFHSIVDELRSDILSGRRRTGDRLPPEHILAEQFQVSRTGVREAVRVLEALGLIEIRHGYAGGAFVAELGLAPLLGALQNSLQMGQVDVSELYEARQLFEPAITRLTVERSNPEVIRQLEENVARAREALASGNDAFAINLQFHAVLAYGAGNRVAGLVTQALVELLDQIDREYPTNCGVSRKAVHDHAELVEAVRAGDGARAEELMVRHLQELEGRFARIQEQVSRQRARRKKAIPPWGGVRLTAGER